MASKRTPVGQALHVHGEAVDHVEALYLQAHGEVTSEVEDAEAARDMAGREAMAALGRYVLWVEDQRAAVAKERQRLNTLDGSYNSRDEWARARLADLAEQHDPGKTKHLVGTMRVGLRHTVATVVGDDLDLSTVPTSWVRTVPEKVTPERHELDKVAAKADLLAWPDDRTRPVGVRLDRRTHVRVD